jgi:RNA polymerase sigma factor (sigma-70 family)
MKSLALTAVQLALLNEHTYLVDRAVSKFRRKGDDDFRQCALIALSKAVKTFKPARGVQFEAYGWKCVSNACWDFLKKRPQPPSHDDVVGYDEEEGEEVTLLNKVENREARSGWSYDSDDMLDAILSVAESEASPLSKIEQQILLLRFDESLPLQAIATQIGCSPKNVHSAIERAIIKLRRHFGKK